MENTELYVNLTDEQQDALNLLEKALDACKEKRVKHADVKDTVDSRLAQWQRNIAQEEWDSLVAKSFFFTSLIPEC